MKTTQTIALLGLIAILAGCNFSPDALIGGGVEPIVVNYDDESNYNCDQYRFVLESQTRDPETNCSELGELDQMVIEAEGIANGYRFALGWLQGREGIEIATTIVQGNVNGRKLEQTLVCEKNLVDSALVSTQYKCLIQKDPGLSMQPEVRLLKMVLKNATCKTTATYVVKPIRENRKSCSEYTGQQTYVKIGEDTLSNTRWTREEK